MTTENKQPDERAMILADLCILASEVNDHTEQSFCAAVLRLANRARATTQQANKGDAQAAFNEWKKDWWFADGGVSENETCSYADAEAAAESAFNAGAALARSAAPQAVTLSDEDIKRIALEYCAEDGAIPSYEWIRFSRALLAAHPEQRMSDAEDAARWRRIECVLEEAQKNGDLSMGVEMEFDAVRAARKGDSQ